MAPFQGAGEKGAASGGRRCAVTSGYVRATWWVAVGTAGVRRCLTRNGFPGEVYGEAQVIWAARGGNIQNVKYLSGGAIDWQFLAG